MFSDGSVTKACFTPSSSSLSPSLGFLFDTEPLDGSLAFTETASGGTQAPKIKDSTCEESALQIIQYMCK